MTYDVSFSDPILGRLSRLKEKVLAIGQGKELGSVLASLMDDLTHRPLEAGETMYYLRQIPMPIKVLTKTYIGVVFAVNEADKIVMVTRMRMLDHHPFPRGFERLLND